MAKAMVNGYPFENNGPERRKCRTLVVDDDPQILRLMECILSKFGHSVSLASNRMEGMHALGCGPYDLIFTDLEMPGSDGMILTSYIKTISPHTPVVLMTVKDKAEVMGRVSGNHADHLLFKPFNLNEIKGIIQRLVIPEKKAADEAWPFTPDPQAVLGEGHEKHPMQPPCDSERLEPAGKLAASFAHSIRNPLSSIKMRLYSLERIEFTPDQKDDLKVIEEEIGNIENLVRDFLEFSRPPRLKTTKISPSDVVDKTIRLLKPELEYRNVQLRLHRSSRLSETWIDAERFKEVLVNLIINGAEADGNSAVSIYEKEEDQAPFGRVAVIEVHDDGEGIPESVQAKIFEPFFTTKAEGTGMGLNIARQIVEAHGGRLTFYSKENEGSIFTITLPCHH